MTTHKAKNKTVSLRVPEILIEMADLISQENGTDRSQVLLQWLYQGAESAVIDLLEQGEISKGYAVQALGTTYHGLNELLETRGVRLGPSDEQLQESRETARSLKPRTGA